MSATNLSASIVAIPLTTLFDPTLAEEMRPVWGLIGPAVAQPAAPAPAAAAAVAAANPVAAIAAAALPAPVKPAKKRKYQKVDRTDYAPPKPLKRKKQKIPKDNNGYSKDAFAKKLGVYGSLISHLRPGQVKFSEEDYITLKTHPLVLQQLEALAKPKEQ